MTVVTTKVEHTLMRNFIYVYAYFTCFYVS